MVDKVSETVYSYILQGNQDRTEISRLTITFTETFPTLEVVLKLLTVSPH